MFSNYFSLFQIHPLLSALLGSITTKKGFGVRVNPTFGSKSSFSKWSSSVDLNLKSASSPDRKMKSWLAASVFPKQSLLPAKQKNHYPNIIGPDRYEGLLEQNCSCLPKPNTMLFSIFVSFPSWFRNLSGLNLSSSGKSCQNVKSKF